MPSKGAVTVKPQDHGFIIKPMPLLPITSPQTLSLCANLPLEPDDVFICSYPKSGTTWAQHIVLSLLIRHATNRTSRSANGDADPTPPPPPPPYEHVSDYAPFFEVDAHWDAPASNLSESIRSRHAALGRRVFNTHLRWDMLPGEGVADDENDSAASSGKLRRRRSGGVAKFVYLIRSPLDVCVSFYHHLSSQVEGCYEEGFDRFFRDWLNGDVAFGSWFDHVLSFAPALRDYSRNDEVQLNRIDGAGAAPPPGTPREAGMRREVLLLAYEDMVSDLEGSVARIVQFLELDTIDRSQLRELLPAFTFRRMKSELDKFQPKSVSWKNDFRFLRKGSVGDSESLVTEEQKAEFATFVDRANLQEKVRAALDGLDDRTHLEKILNLIE